VVPFVVALALAGATAAWAVTGAVTVKAAKNTTLGSIVVNAHGLTLYHLTSEKAGKIGCTGACAKEWPPLLVSGSAKPVAGSGVVATKLGTVKRPDGTVQVTYAGAPLYRFDGDTTAGQAKGEAVGGVWFAVAPSGAIVKPAAAAASSSSSTGSPSYSTTTTTSSTGMYGSGY
jgi:predicted lipoprotein with Yx(FWY)xxD motif